MALAARRLARRRSFAPHRDISTLILLRHGTSEWNGAEARFSGWCDIPLTVRGRVEAVAAGQLLRARGFPARRIDVAFASELQRAHETCELALASMAGHCQHTWSTDRIQRDRRLNERHYGALQGWKKNDPELVDGFGADALLGWKRSMHARPPALDCKHPEWRPPPAPTSESLADCQARVLECFEDLVKPRLFASPTQTVLLVAHSNTLRALMAAIDGVEDDLVPKLHVPNSVPILYRFDPSTRTPISVKLGAGSGGSHARWMLSPENHAQVHNALQSGGLLTRAWFESLDVDRRGKLTVAEIDAGLQAYLKDSALTDDGRVDCVVTAVAKKIVRDAWSEAQRPSDVTITLREFEAKANAACSQLPSRQDLLHEDDIAWGPRWD